MGLFRRRQPPEPGPPAAAIMEFWTWWPGARPRLEAAIEAGDPGELAAQLTDQVARMHPDLEWEFGAGRAAKHALTVSGGGSSELRGLAERWYRLAPPPDDTWEFHPARPADPDALETTLRLNDHELELGHVDLAVRVDARRARVDITAYHPDFAFLPEGDRMTVTYRVLDWALGEDDVARWIGTVRTAAERPVDPIPARVLGAVVHQVAEMHEPGWIVGKGTTARGRPALITVRFPLRRVDYPLFELHILLTLPYAHANSDRLPIDPSAAALRRIEEVGLGGLADRLLLAGHETGDDTRVFHLYTDPQSGALAEVETLAAGWTEGRASVVAAMDPGWTALGPFIT